MRQGSLKNSRQAPLKVHPQKTHDSENVLLTGIGSVHKKFGCEIDQ